MSATKRTAKYQINIALNKEEIELWEEAKKTVGYNNKDVAMLGAKVILDEKKETKKKLVDFQQ